MNTEPIRLTLALDSVERKIVAVVVERFDKGSTITQKVSDAYASRLSTLCRERARLLREIERLR